MDQTHSAIIRMDLSTAHVCVITSQLQVLSTSIQKEEYGAKVNLQMGRTHPHVHQFLKPTTHTCLHLFPTNSIMRYIKQNCNLTLSDVFWQYG